MNWKLILAVILALLITPIIGALVWLVMGTAAIYLVLNRKQLQTFIADAKEVASGKRS